MLRTSGCVTLILLWILVGFGLGFSGLLPFERLSASVFLHPFWYSFRALLGDFDVAAVYDALGDSHDPSTGIVSTVAVVLLLLCAYFATIVIVNLMVAIMTSAYQAVREESALNRKFRRVALVRDYLQRPTLPAPFNLLLLGYRLVRALVWPLLVCCSILLGDLTRIHATFASFADEHVAPEEADRLLLHERACRNKWLTRPLEPIADLAAGVNALAAAQAALAARLDGGFENGGTRVGRLEARLGRIEELLRSLLLADEAVAPGRPEWASPASMTPLNVMPPLLSRLKKGLPAAPTASADGTVYPPASSRARHREMVPATTLATAVSGARPVHLTSPSTLAYNGEALPPTYRTAPPLGSLAPLSPAGANAAVDRNPI